MEWFFVCLVIVFVLLFLLFFPLFFQITFELNVLKTQGKIVFKIFFIKVKDVVFNLAENGIVIFYKNLTKQVDFKKLKFLFLMFLSLFWFLKIFSLKMMLKFGNKNNAFFTANINGIFLLLMNFFKIFLHTNKNIRVLDFKLSPQFQTNTLNFSFNSKCCLTLFAVVTSFFVAKLKIKQGENNV